VLWLCLVLLAGLLLLLLLAFLFLPVRILIHYHRENNNGRLLLAVKLLRWRLELSPDPVKGPFLSMASRVNPANVKKALPELRRAIRKIPFRDLRLELKFGLENPAATGLLAGGGWAAGGTLISLLASCLTLENRPQLKIVPVFEPAPLEITGTVEMKITGFQGLKILFILLRKKVLGGASGGTSSH
jgi:hypothetical protein